MIAVLFVTCAHGQEYYKWVDAAGVTHYGEVLPDPDTEYEAFDFTERYTSANPGDDYYSIQNQLKRVQEQRLLWRELNVPEGPEQNVVVQEVVYQPEEVRYVPVYPYRYKRHHYKDKHHYKRQHKDYKQGKKHYQEPASKSYRRSNNLKMPKRNPALIVKTH
jgi:hypothetical protein